jgi:hypothetical protein
MTLTNYVSLGRSILRYTHSYIFNCIHDLRIGAMLANTHVYGFTLSDQDRCGRCTFLRTLPRLHSQLHPAQLGPKQDLDGDPKRPPATLPGPLRALNIEQRPRESNLQLYLRHQPLRDVKKHRRSNHQGEMQIENLHSHPDRLTTPTRQRTGRTEIK